MKKKFKLGIIGAGFIAYSIVSGLKNAIKSPINPKHILISDTEQEALDKLTHLKVKTTLSNAEVFDSCEYVMLCIKPQVFKQLSGELAKFFPKKIISVMAGVTKSKIKETFKDALVARCMPNTPISIGLGITALDLSDFDAADREFINSIFAVSGETLWVDEEKLNAVTAISGSGPAYVYKFMESIADSGVTLGLSRDEALLLTISTVIGAGTMALENNDKTIKELIDSVTSKGGTTAAAIESLDKDGFSKVIERAVKAAANRAEELKS